VLIDIFQKKDLTVIDRNFAEPFVQHDPNLADGVIGMKSFATEIASSPQWDWSFRQAVRNRRSDRLGAEGLLAAPRAGRAAAPT
jgi:hypothetical protein